MTHAELARKIRDAIYERSNDEGGAISREQMDDAIEKTLRAQQTNPYAGGAYCVGVGPTTGALMDVRPSNVAVPGLEFVWKDPSSDFTIWRKAAPTSCPDLDLLTDTTYDHAGWTSDPATGSTKARK